MVQFSTVQGVRRGLTIALALAMLAAPHLGCRKPPSNERGASIVPGEGIQKAMEAHVDKLMAIPGVVGVAIGALEDGRPCILVLVVKKTAENRKSIPAEIEGYPVKIEESGVIRPMPGDSGR
jgi:hypothetical protein